MAAIFGLSFLFSKQGLQALTPMVLLAYRFGIATIIMLGLCGLKIIKIDIKGKPVLKVIRMSLFYPVLAFIFEINGINYTSTSLAGVMVSLMPIFVSLLGIVLLKEVPSFKQWTCIIISVAGVIITVVFTRNGGQGTTFIGLIFLLLSVLGGSVQNVLSRKYSLDFTPLELTFIMNLMGGISFNFLAIMQGLIEGNLVETYLIPWNSPTAMGAVVYLGVFASVVAFSLMNYILSKLKAASASTFSNLATVVSILAGIFFLSERLTWYQSLGAMLILAGVWGANYYKGKGIVRKIEN